MSIVDDTRKLLQDLIAPELRALQVQVSSLEKTTDARFASGSSAIAVAGDTFLLYCPLQQICRSVSRKQIS